MKKSHYDDDEYFEENEDFTNDEDIDDYQEDDTSAWEDKFDEMTDNDYDIDWNDPEMRKIYYEDDEEIDDNFDNDIDDPDEDNWDI